MTPPPRLVVLDVNETLSDMRPLQDRFADVGAPRLLAGTWFAGVLRDGFALTVSGGSPSFAELGQAGLRALLPAAGVAGDALDDAVEHVMSGFLSLPVHPDVGPGLEALAAAGIRLVTLSNGSAEVARTLLGRAGLGHLVERFLTVEDAGVWKPAAAAYRYALAECGVDAVHAMLVAAHPWDIDGAHRAGLRTAYVDQTGTPYPRTFSTPELVVTGLDDLATRFG